MISVIIFASIRVIRGLKFQPIIGEHRRIEASVEDGEIDEGNNPQSEKEQITLQISHLNQAQQRAGSPRPTARAAHAGGVDDPAIKKSGDARKALLCRINQPAVKFVEVKEPSQKYDIKGLTCAVAIERDR